MPAIKTLWRRRSITEDVAECPSCDSTHAVLSNRGSPCPLSEGRPHPHLGFTNANHAARAIDEALAARGLHAWSGNFYAVEAVARMGLAISGRLLRRWLCYYNTADEVARTVEAIASITQ